MENKELFNFFKNRYENEKKHLAEDKGQFSVYSNLIKEKEEQIKKIQEDIAVLEKTQSVLLTLGAKQREAVKKEFEEIVTKGLQYIMEEDIYFEIEVKELRGVSNVEFYVKTIRDGIITKTTLSESRGDGIVDIVSLALSIAVFINTDNKGPLVLDEPCRQVSEKYKLGVGMFLKEMANTMDIQIFMITHISKYVDCADNKFKVELRGTKSVVSQI